MSLSVGVDFYCFTVMDTVDPDSVIERYLELNPGDFSEQGYGVKGYRECRYYDDIRVYYNSVDGSEKVGGAFMGVYVCMSGDALRQYSRLGKDILLLMARTSGIEAVHITRVDFNADDRGGILDIDRMIEYCDNYQIRTRTRRCELVRSRDGRVAPANTLYIGSRSSEEYARIYDKAKEQCDPYKQPEEYNSHWIRVEMVLRRKRAARAVIHVLQSLERGGNLGECFAEIVNGFMTFIEKDDSNISRCSVAEWWECFLGTLKAVKLYSTERTVHKFERKMVWFYENIAPMASALLDGVGELQLLRMLSVAEDKRRDEYNKMLGVYLRDNSPAPIGDILGLDYRRKSARWYRTDSYRVRGENERSCEWYSPNPGWSEAPDDGLSWEQLTYGREYEQSALAIPV